MLWMMAGSELHAATLWGALGQPAANNQAPSPGQVEILDPAGRPVNRGGWADPEPGFTVEEQRAPGVQRWVVRDSAGKILFVSDTPLRW